MASKFKPVAFCNENGSKIIVSFPIATTKFDSAKRRQRVKFSEKLWSGRGHPTNLFRYTNHYYMCDNRNSIYNDRIFENSKFAVTKGGRFATRQSCNIGVEFCIEDSDGNILFGFHNRAPHVWSVYRKGNDFYFKKNLNYDEIFSNRIIL